MEKRLIIAIGLSILIIVLFQTLFPQQHKKETIQQAPTRTPALNRQTPQTTIPPSANVPPQELTKEETSAWETDRYILLLTNIGGAIKEIRLKEYKNSQDNKPLEIIRCDLPAPYVFSTKSNSLITDLNAQPFVLSRKDNNYIDYSFVVPGKFTITKSYRFHNTNDYIELHITIQNTGTGEIYKDYDLIGASGIQTTGLAMGRRFVEIDSMVDGKISKNTRVKNGEIFIRGITSWTGIRERYFSVILKPMQDVEGVIVSEPQKGALASGIRSKRIAIYPGASVEDSYILYVGPNDLNRLSALGLGLEQIVDYGIFGGITKVLLTMLRTFQKVVQNWGLAIIMLTCVVNLCLFPLTKRSFSSMKKIQDVQPHIEKIRKLHKDNPQRLNKELADLYKQYKVNPLGGCLPLLVQMPIFIALYQGLMRSIELKGAHFLWIKDLSSPDYIKLPLTLPLIGNNLHILPILMAIAMFFQQKMSAQSMAAASPEQAQQQKMMLIFFPIFFGFLFYNFPSGLVLYWLTNTVLMSTEHAILRKRLN